MTDERLELFSTYFGFGMGAADNVTIWHESGRAYTLFSVVIREHDLVPCALYGMGPAHPMWVRPLREVLHSGKWQWPNRWNRLMTDLSIQLGKYETETSV